MQRDREFGTSVLLPVYFRQGADQESRFLRRAIESVQRQTYPGPHEILIIDDGSPTPIETLRMQIGPAELFENVRFIRTSRNNGLVNALNFGLNESRYPFIARMDHDDRWSPGKIAKQFALFSADPDLSISATGMTLVDSSSKVLETHVRPGDWSGILNFFIDVGCPFPHGSVLARRDVWRLLGGYSHDPSTAHCEDYALWGIWLRFFKPAMVEEALYDYTVSDHSVSSAHRSQQASASGQVNARFRALDPVQRVPAALMALAEAFGISVLEAGKLAYSLWAFRMSVRAPVAAVSPLRQLMPDRIVMGHPDRDRSVVEVERLIGRPAPIEERDTVRVQVL